MTRSKRQKILSAHLIVRPSVLFALLLVCVLAVIAQSAPSKEQKAGAGISYFNDVVPEIPWSIYVVKVDRAQTDLELTPTLARGMIIGLSPLSAQLEAIPRNLGIPVVAINGDFYQTENEACPGDPRGLEILRGELVSAPSGGASSRIARSH